MYRTMFTLLLVRYSENTVLVLLLASTVLVEFWAPKTQLLRSATQAKMDEESMSWQGKH